MRTIVLLICILNSLSFYADDNALNSISPNPSESPSPIDLLRGNGMNFIENKGQVIDMNNNLRPDILYVGDGGGMQVYLRRGGISYVLSKTEGLENETEMERELLQQGSSMEEIQKELEKLREKANFKIQRIDLDFLDCNPEATILPSEQVDGYLNYYYAHCPQGITGLHAYNRVVYQNIYPNIDVVFYGGKEEGLKYDIIVRPGGNPNDIKLKYNGADNIEVIRHRLKVISSLGVLTEELPRVYQNSNGKIIDVEAEYKLDGITVSLQLTTYNLQLPLIIDPWITYYGGSGTERGSGITVDRNGNTFISGYTNSPDFPVSAGAFQTNFTGGPTGGWGDADVFVLKFNGSSGARLWATYYGGNGTDNCTGIAIDPFGSAFISGYTRSSDLPVTTGAFQTSYGLCCSQNSSFVAKFDGVGARLWATYYGQSASTGVATDGLGNVFIAGYSNSPTLPLLAGFQMSNAGNFDAFIIKFDGSGTRLWATYFGGGASDQCWSIATDGPGNVFIGGYTSSTNFPVSPGAFQTSNAGWGSDAFVAKFTNSGAFLWATYYGGSGAEWAGYGITADGLGNVILSGYTNSVNLPVLAGFQMSNAGGFDVFVVKFSATGARLWATYCGGSGYDWGFRITTDTYNNIYLLWEMEDYIDGRTFSCAFQKTLNTGGTSIDGPEDQIITKLGPNGNHICDTYLGGSSEDDVDYYIGGIAYYKGSVFITATTRGPGYPVTPGAFQTAHAGGFYDVTIAKICGLACGEPYTVTGNFSANATSACINTPINFSATSNAGLVCDSATTTYLWNFTGATILTSTLQNPSNITWTAPGTYNVSVKVETLCDTLILTQANYINIIPCGLTLQTTGQSVCPGSCATVSASATNGTPPYNYIWSSASGGGVTGQSISVCPTISTSYTITATDSTGLSTTSTATVVVGNQFSAFSSTTNVNCNGQNNGTASVNPAGGVSPYTYNWSVGSSLSGISNLVQGNYSVTITDALGCLTNTIVSITEPNILSVTTNTATANCNQGSGSASVNPSGGTGPYSYLWSNGASTQQISNLSSATYSVIVTDDNGCTIATTITVGNMPGVTAQLTSSASTNCFGSCDANAFINGSGGTTPYTYLWSTGATDASISNLCAAAYTATITDAGGCFSTANVSITGPSQLSVVSYQLPVNCFGDSTGSAGVNVSGGASPYSYNWLPVIGNQSSANGLIAGSYTITVTDNNNCSTDTIITITEPPGLSYTVSTTDETCGQGNGTSTIHLTGGAPGYYYFWSSASGGNDSIIAGQSSGTYSVIVFDNNGCTIQTIATINNAGGLTAAIASVSNVSCNVVNDGSAAVSASGGSMPYTYLWSNNATTQQISNLIADNYTVIVTDVNGCSQMQVVSITQPVVPIALISGGDSICPGANITLSASGGTSYEWSTGETSSTINQQPITNTIYTVIVSNGACTDSATVEVIVFSNPLANAGNDTTILAGQTIVLRASSTLSGSDGYSWSTGETTTTITQQPTTTTTYFLTVTDNNDCASIDTVIIFVATPCDSNTEVFVPNSFSPNADGQNDFLSLYSSGIPETIYFSIYNRWGEKIFECSDLSSTWDGTYRNKLCDTAVFTWILKTTCEASSVETIKAGNISLMR